MHTCGVARSISFVRSPTLSCWHCARSCFIRTTTRQMHHIVTEGFAHCVHLALLHCSAEHYWTNADNRSLFDSYHPYCLATYSTAVSLSFFIKHWIDCILLLLRRPLRTEYFIDLKDFSIACVVCAHRTLSQIVLRPHYFTVTVGTWTHLPADIELTKYSIGTHLISSVAIFFFFFFSSFSLSSHWYFGNLVRFWPYFTSFLFIWWVSLDFSKNPNYSVIIIDNSNSLFHSLLTVKPVALLATLFC